MEDLAEFYKKGEHALLVFTETKEVGKIRAEVEERNKQLQTVINGVVAENLELKSRMSRMELDSSEFRKRMQTELVELKKMIEKEMLEV